MKWNVAVQKIEKALDARKVVEIRYHRKWMKNDSHFGQVESVCEYEYDDWKFKAVITFNDQLDDGAHIIDEVIVKEAEINN